MVKLKCSDQLLNSKYPIILIVDDQVYHAEAIKILFDALGVQSEIAMSGDQAALMVQQRFEMMEKDASVDYNMPKMNTIDSNQLSTIKIFKLFQTRGIPSEDKDKWPYVSCPSTITNSNFIEQAKHVRKLAFTSTS